MERILLRAYPKSHPESAEGGKDLRISSLLPIFAVCAF